MPSPPSTTLPQLHRRNSLLWSPPDIVVAPRNTKPVYHRSQSVTLAVSSGSSRPTSPPQRKSIVDATTSPKKQQSRLSLTDFVGTRTSKSERHLHSTTSPIKLRKEKVDEAMHRSYNNQSLSSGDNATITSTSTSSTTEESWTGSPVKQQPRTSPTAIVDNNNKNSPKVPQRQRSPSPQPQSQQQNNRRSSSSRRLLLAGSSRNVVDNSGPFTRSKPPPATTPTLALRGRSHPHEISFVGEPRSGGGRSQSKCRTNNKSSRNIVEQQEPETTPQRRRSSPTRLRTKSPAKSRLISASSSRRQLDTSASLSRRNLDNSLNTGSAPSSPTKSSTTKTKTTAMVDPAVVGSPKKIRRPVAEKEVREITVVNPAAAASSPRKVRRPLTAEELEVACKANPSLREAIASHTGQTCRLGKVKLPDLSASSTTTTKAARSSNDAVVDSSDDSKKKSTTTTKMSSSSSTINSNNATVVRRSSSSRKPAQQQKSVRSPSIKKRNKKILSEDDSNPDMNNHDQLVRSPTKTRQNNHKKLDAMMNRTTPNNGLSPAHRSFSYNNVLSPAAAKNLVPAPLLAGSDHSTNDLNNNSPDAARRLLSGNDLLQLSPPQGSSPPHQQRPRTTLSVLQPQWSSARTLSTTTATTQMPKPLLHPTVFSKNEIPCFGQKKPNNNVSLSNLTFQESVDGTSQSTTAPYQELFEESQSAMLGEKLRSINDTLIRKELGRYSEAPKPPQRQKSVDDLCHPLLLRPRSARTFSNESMNSSIDDSYINGHNNNHHSIWDEDFDGPEPIWCPVHA